MPESFRISRLLYLSFRVNFEYFNAFSRFRSKNRDFIIIFFTVGFNPSFFPTAFIDIPSEYGNIILYYKTTVVYHETKPGQSNSH
jgi:hypothetical protein